jgi:hypothetical protein
MRTLSDESLGRLTSEMVIRYLEAKGWVESVRPRDERLFPISYVRPEDKKCGVGWFPNAKTNYFSGGLRRVLEKLEHFEDRDASEIVREMLGLPDPVAQSWSEAGALLDAKFPWGGLMPTEDALELLNEFRRRAGS